MGAVPAEMEADLRLLCDISLANSQYIQLFHSFLSLTQDGR